MPHGTVNNPLGLCLDCARWDRHHRLSSFRDGARHPHGHAADRGRRNGGRLGQGEGCPGAGRRGQVRQSGHRRLALNPALFHADASGWRRGANDAGSGRSKTLGRGHRRRGSKEPRGDPEIDRQEARIWRTGRRRQHHGRALQCQPRKNRRRNACQSASQGPFRVPLHRQGRDQHCRWLQHHDRARHLRTGCPCARPEIRRDRAAAGYGRQGREL